MFSVFFSHARLRPGECEFDRDVEVECGRHFLKQRQCHGPTTSLKPSDGRLACPDPCCEFALAEPGALASVADLLADIERETHRRARSIEARTLLRRHGR